MSVSPESDMQTNRNTSWQGTCIECSYVCSCHCIVILHEPHKLLDNGMSCNNVLFCSVLFCSVLFCSRVHDNYMYIICSMLGNHCNIPGSG